MLRMTPKIGIDQFIKITRLVVCVFVCVEENEDV